MNSLDSFDFLWVRIVPPILVALAWRLSGVKLVPEYDGLRAWKFLGLAVSVAWLASVGTHGWACNEWVAWVSLGAGLLAGFGAQIIPQKSEASLANYGVKFLYASMHGCITAALGLFLFLAMRPEKTVP